MRHLVLTTLFLAAMASLSVLESSQLDRAEPISVTPSDTVPDSALVALRQGRYLKASLILREFMAAGTADSMRAAVLLTAQAQAGLGDWEAVQRLLAGRDWLDDVAAAEGWYLLGRSQLELGLHEASAESFERYLERAENVGDRRKGIAELRHATALREASRVPEAIEAYDRTAALLPQIAEWIAIQSASAAAGAGDTALVASRVALLGNELRRDWEWRLRITAHTKANDPAGALRYAEAAAANDALTANRRGEAWVRVGEIRLLGGDSAGARAAFLRSMSVAPGGSGIDAARMLTGMNGLSASDRLRIGRVYLRHGNIDRGVAGMKAYVDARAGTPAERLAIRGEIGRALFNADRYDEAEKMLLEVVRFATSPSSAASALFLAGRAQYRDGRQTLARQTFMRVAERYPDTDAAAQAMYLSADLDHDDGNLSRARERYRRTIGMSSDVDEVGLAHMRLGALAYQEGNFEVALSAFDNYRKVYPSGRRFQQASYWAALALRKLGDEEGARRRLEETRLRDPISYYGGRATQILGRTLWDARLEPSPQPDPLHMLQVTRELERVDLLREIGWSDAAAYELERARRNLASADGADYALAEALNARGFTSYGISLGWDIYRREGAWNARLLRIIYPFPFREMVSAEATERGVDPFLAAALIRQESNFSAGAVSPVGAIGLMQVMPSTGRTLARSLEIERFSPVMLKQAEVNIHLGMIHLADQLRTYRGRLPVVLAAYNAGSGRIDRWREFPEFADDEQFAERIPFTETRDYVKIVQNNARLYAALYGETANR
jgi:soluble lytic murein transglycosylase